ncbi:MAG TPA: hypothetical protein VEW68_08180 [Patescibacteria group bacterium]|nr:hypothetical protein [Patescibacteria group bacterium]
MAFNLMLLAAGAASLLLAGALAAPGISRRELAHLGIALVAMAAIAFADSLDLVILVLLAVGVARAALVGPRDFAVRLRPPVVAASLLAIALVLARVQGPDVLARFAAVGLVAGLTAAVGVLPYIHPHDADADLEPDAIWIGFLGPVLAAAVLFRARGLLSPDAGGELGAMLIGIGLLNMLWGTLAAWRTRRDSAAWHYSFMSDWGLVLCGFGITVADGRSAALLVFLCVLLGRFPLLAAARAVDGPDSTADRPINLLLAAMLAGSAPFAGFAARVLLLRGAVEIAWPLAVVLAIGMLLWLPSSLRLARGLARPTRRRAVALAALLAVNAAIGLYPLPILQAAGS